MGNLYFWNNFQKKNSKKPNCFSLFPFFGKKRMKGFSLIKANGGFFLKIFPEKLKGFFGFSFQEKIKLKKGF